MADGILTSYSVARSSHWFRQVTAPCNVALGWHAIIFAKTSAILEFYMWFRFRPYHRSRHVILHQSANFYPNRTTLGRLKWRHVGILWKCLMLVELEWLGYRMVKKLWQYVKPFSSDTGALRTDGRTDTRTGLLYQYRVSNSASINENHTSLFIHVQMSRMKLHKLID